VVGYGKHLHGLLYRAWFVSYLFCEHLAYAHLGQSGVVTVHGYRVFVL
jgi:hypothetical protein